MEGFLQRDDLGINSLAIFQDTIYELGPTLHWHTYSQICVCIDGRGKFIFSNKEYSVEKGDIFIISKFISHLAIPESKNSTTYIFLAFSDDLIAPVGSSKFDYLQPFRYTPSRFDNKIENTQPVAKKISDKLIELKEIYDQKDFGFKHALDAGIRTILSLLINYYAKIYPSDFITLESVTVNINLAFNYINMNFLKKITIKELAELLHISKSRFRHLFKDTIHMGFKEYVTYLRLSEAKKLLLTSDISIADIAYHSGWNNLTHFYKVFQKYVFLSPSQYRKNYQITLKNSIAFFDTI